MNRTSSLIILPLCLFSLVANSAPLSLGDLIRIGLRQNPAVKKAQSDLAAAQATTSEFRGALFPNISLNVSQTSNENPLTLTGVSTGTNTPRYSELYNAYLLATQPLYAGGGLTAAIDERRITEEIATLTKTSIVQATVQTIVGAYFGYAQQARLYKAALDNQNILDAYKNIITRFEHIGRARVTDRLLAEVNLVSAKAAVSDLDAAVVAQKEILRQTLAMDELPEVDLESGSNITKTEKINAGEAVSIAMKSNPDILNALKQPPLIDSEKDVDVSQDLPSLNLKGEYGYQSPDQSNWQDSSAQFGMIQVNLTVPLFSGLSSIYKRRSYELQKESATHAADTEKLLVESTLKQNLKLLTDTYESLELARDAAIKARNALEIGNRDFQRALISPQDVLTLQTTRYSAEQYFITTLFKYLNALLSVRQLMGINLEDSYAKR
jgi:outer membrane protein